MNLDQFKNFVVCRRAIFSYKHQFNPLPDDKILGSSKLREFADDNFKLDENGRKLSKQVENIVEKGEIARYEQFLLFPQCFQKACFPEASKGVIVWEWVNQVVFLELHLYIIYKLQFNHLVYLKLHRHVGLYTMVLTEMRAFKTLYRIIPTFNDSGKKQPF